MPSTTVRVDTSTRDAVKSLADADGVSLDEEIRALARAERQRRMGQALHHVDLDEDDNAWLNLATSEVGTVAGG